MKQTIVVAIIIVVVFLDSCGFSGQRFFLYKVLPRGTEAARRQVFEQSKPTTKA